MERVSRFKTFREFVEIVQQEGFSYGSKKYQQELEKKRTEAKQKKEQEAQQRSDELYQERTRGRGIRAVHKGKSGYMKDGKFTPDT
jgi:glutamyl/glutaminyl-tRNA synthetase